MGKDGKGREVKKLGGGEGVRGEAEGGRKTRQGQRIDKGRDRQRERGKGGKEAERLWYARGGDSIDPRNRMNILHPFTHTYTHTHTLRASFPRPIAHHIGLGSTPRAINTAII